MLPYQKTDLKKYQYFFHFTFFFGFVLLSPTLQPANPTTALGRQLYCCVWSGELLGGGSAINHHYFHLLQANRIFLAFTEESRAD